MSGWKSKSDVKHGEGKEKDYQGLRGGRECGAVGLGFLREGAWATSQGCRSQVAEYRQVDGLNYSRVRLSGYLIIRMTLMKRLSHHQAVRRSSEVM